MLKLRRIGTFHEFVDDQGRRWMVRLASGMNVATVETPLGKERIEWQEEWGRYSPLSEATAERAVQEFCDRQNHRQPFERANAELLHVGESKPPRPRHSVAAVARSTNRQLPPGDR